MNSIIIVGAGGHARVVIDAVRLNKLDIHGIIDINYSEKSERINGYPLVGGFDYLDHINPKNYDIVIAIGDNDKRDKYFSKVVKLGFNLPNIAHPTSILSKYVTIGKGVFINSGVIINSMARIGDNTIINTGAIIEHEVIIGKNCHICPGVKLTGRVHIGRNTFIGIGTSVIDHIMINENVTIGAGSVIINNIDKNLTVAGSPAKKI